MKTEEEGKILTKLYRSKRPPKKIRTSGTGFEPVPPKRYDNKNYTIQVIRLNHSATLETN